VNKTAQNDGASDINCMSLMLRPFDSEIESNSRRFQNGDYAWQHPDARSTISVHTQLSVSRQKQFPAPHK
jgi:hypothetical protein